MEQNVADGTGHQKNTFFFRIPGSQKTTLKFRKKQVSHEKTKQTFTVRWILVV